MDLLRMPETDANAVDQAATLPPQCLELSSLELLNSLPT